MSLGFSNLSIFNIIKFDEKTHTYFIENEQTPISVTQIIQKYKKPFNSQKLAEQTSKKLNLSVEEVLALWDELKDYSNRLGTAAHKYFEQRLNGAFPSWKNYIDYSKLSTDFVQKVETFMPKIIDYFNNFLNHVHLVPLKTEFVVGDIHGSKVCGTIDLLAWNPALNRLEIYDFKTNKRLSSESQYNEFLLPPLQHLSSCELTTYTLQQNFYKYFIEKYTPYKIESLKLVWLCPEVNDDFKIIELNNDVESVKLILSDFEHKKQLIESKSN